MTIQTWEVRKQKLWRGQGLRQWVHWTSVFGDFPSGISTLLVRVRLKNLTVKWHLASIHMRTNYTRSWREFCLWRVHLVQEEQRIWSPLWSRCYNVGTCALPHTLLISPSSWTPTSRRLCVITAVDVLQISLDEIAMTISLQTAVSQTCLFSIHISYRIWN